jgi:signal transduction histidine kinase
VNAGAALHVLNKGPDPSPQMQRSLQAIRQASVGALDELRSTLANFTGPVEAPSRPAPGRSVSGVQGAVGGVLAGPRRPATLPGLALLPRLVAATEVAGLSVRHEEAGEPAGVLSAAADLAAYRIVQEALANVVRHADARHAVVGVVYQPDGVLVTVTDDGRAVPLAHPSGTGLDSMRDRAASVGAVWTAGPRPGGGFEVRTCFSYEGGRS